MQRCAALAFAALAGTAAASPPGNTTCGGSCAFDLDCDQTSKCNLCVAGAAGSKCAAGCMDPCDSDSQCGATWCTKCIDQKCQHPAPAPPAPAPGPVKACNDACTVNTDCDQTSKCKLCVKGAAGFKCAVGCMDACDSDSQCGTTWCTKCIDQKCQHPSPAPAPAPAPGPAKTCNDACAVNTDCDQTGDCTACVTDAAGANGKCGAVCAGKCASDSECATTWCSKCIDGECQHPAAGPKPPSHSW